MTVAHVSTKPNAVWHICLASLEDSNELVDVQNYFPLNKTLVVAQWYAKNHTEGAICAKFSRNSTTYFPCIPDFPYIPSPFKFLTFSLQLFMKESSIYIIGSGPNSKVPGNKSRLPTSLMLQQLTIPVAQHWSWSPNLWVWCLFGNFIQSDSTWTNQYTPLNTPPHTS